MKVNTSKSLGSFLLAIGLLMFVFLVMVGHPLRLDEFWIMCISTLISSATLLTRKPLYLDLEQRQLSIGNMLWDSPKVYSFDSLKQFSVHSNDIFTLCLKFRTSDESRVQTIQISKLGLDGYDLQKFIYIMRTHQE